MNANESSGPRRALGASLACALVMALVSGAGCFLYPSPDDSWSDAYGQAPPDASDASEAEGAAVATTEAGSACVGRSPSCVDCCDRAFGPSSGSDFYAAVFDCICPDLCKQCGAQCTSAPDPNETCASCLAANAAATCASGAIRQRCSVGSPCHDYAACMAGCTP